ncbi:MAG: zinc ribbon domain-containing protein [Ignavibacteriales bacterium]|nr:MAG: zinc ribbon domain-containing protein [Ignavibacteriales bacterium]
MPTYDYVCSSCGHQFEHFQSMSSAPLSNCPSCSAPVKRKIGSGIAPIFKGSGFYQTDYKNSAPAASGGNTPESKPAAETKPASETASAPAA